MVERLRALLEHPLDPRVARAVVTLASAASVGFGMMIALGVLGHSDGAAGTATRPHSEHRRALLPDAAAREPVTRAAHLPQQDPQDRRGSAARHRAQRELDGHRALQHVPFHEGNLRIELVGARGPRAVLEVGAPTRAEARRGYRQFLRRYRDDGSSYRFRFRARGGRRG